MNHLPPKKLGRIEAEGRIVFRAELAGILISKMKEDGKGPTFIFSKRKKAFLARNISSDSNKFHG
jgi:hypothetical protein